MTRVNKQLFMRIVAFVISLVFLFSCSAKQETVLEKIKRTGTIRIGYANDIPYGYVTEEGHLTGEAPEIARVVMKKMGVDKLEGIFVEFGSLIDGLKAGRFDMIAAGMFVLPNRCREISFSEPTYRVGQAFAVKADNPKNLHSYKDVAQRKDAILCVMKGAVEVTYAKESGIPESQLLTVPNTTSGIAAVVNGQADALALTSLSIQNLIEKTNNANVVRAAPFSNPIINGKTISGYGAFGFRKEDKDLLREFNQHLKPFIGTKEHAEIVRPFGFADFPEGVSTAELCTE